MSQPGYLAVGGREIANNARTAAYLGAGLATSQFQVESSDLCPDLTSLAFPLATCPGLAAAYANQLYTDPSPTWRVPDTGAPPTSTNVVWREAGYVGIFGPAGSGNGVILPDLGVVQETVRVAINVKQQPTTLRAWMVGRYVEVGTASPGWIGAQLRFTSGSWQFWAVRRPPTQGEQGSALQGTLPYNGPEDFWWETVFGTSGFTTTLYGSDPAVAGAPILLTGSYGYDASPLSLWRAQTGLTELEQMQVVTETGIGGLMQSFAEDQVVITEIDVLPGAPCTPTGTSYPYGGAFPSATVYPGVYGSFVTPGNDHAPWFDPARPASGDYMGLVITQIQGLDTTETRTMSGNATGIGGILGPQTLGPRELKVSGYVSAATPGGMQYARRWLAEALAGALCPGCEGDYVDLLLTCGSNESDADLWRVYDAGLTALEFDTSDSDSCDYVTPVSFTIAAADPYLYKLPELAVAETLLNPDGPDTPLVPFETWLFGAETPVCATLADPDVGIDAPIFMFDGGTSGIESAVVYRKAGHYPGSSVYPGECVYPANGLPQWDMSVCPFSFMLSIGPGEAFVVDNSRRRLEWYLRDGTALNGAPKLNLPPGQVVQWIDTCDGADLTACAVAYSGCTCDDTASVTIYSQHRER